MTPERRGGGRPLVLLLHSYLGTGASWGRVAREVEAFADVLAPDLRGHGSACRHGPGMALEQLVSDLSPLVERERPGHVVGHSLGGLVALDRAAPPGRCRELAAEHGWRFDLVPWGSHELLFEQPQTVARWIQRRVLGLGDESRSAAAESRATVGPQ